MPAASNHDIQFMYQVTDTTDFTQGSYRNLQIGSWHMYKVACLRKLIIIACTIYKLVCKHVLVRSNQLLILTRWYMYVYALYFRQEIGVLEKVLCATGKPIQNRTKTMPLDIAKTQKHLSSF